MLVLSVDVARSVGTWVLAMGAVRYLFAMAGWVLPWMRAQLPARRWRKVVAATAGIALVFAASGLGPVAMTYAALGVGFLLLAESFGRDVWWLWCRRPVAQGRRGPAWRQRAPTTAVAVTQVTRTTYDDALLRARRGAFAPGEFVGQESFMTRGEILSVAHRAGIGPSVSVLDLCCGVAGPGRLVAAELGCTYLGIDRDEGAVALARARSAGLGCRFEVGEVPPVPSGSFDVVMLLETLLAFPDKDALLSAVASALVPGGRLALTVEDGQPLSGTERDEMPGADTVWPIPLAELVSLLAHVGLGCPG